MTEVGVCCTTFEFFRPPQVRRCKRGPTHACPGPMTGDVIFLSTGCQWRYLQRLFRVQHVHHLTSFWWQMRGGLDRIHHAPLPSHAANKAEREAQPHRQAIIDSQSVEKRRKGGRSSIRMAMMRGQKSKAISRPLGLEGGRTILCRYAWFCCLMPSYYRPAHSGPRWRQIFLLPAT